MAKRFGRLYQACKGRLQDGFAVARARVRLSQPKEIEQLAVSDLPTPERLTEDQQWGRLEDFVTSEIDRHSQVMDMQDEAGRHLDAAHYALDRIAVELVDVMPSITALITAQPSQLVSLAAVAKRDEQARTQQRERAQAAA